MKMKFRFEVKNPQEGDFVEYEDGKFARISRIGDSFQLSNQIGIYVWEAGSQASGCTWDPNLDYIGRDKTVLQNLQATAETKGGRCWTFSGNQAGGGRGVWFEINFKVWKLHKSA